MRLSHEQGMMGYREPGAADSLLYVEKKISEIPSGVAEEGISTVIPRCNRSQDGDKSGF